MDELNPKALDAVVSGARKIDLTQWRFDNLPEYGILVPFDTLRALVDAARRGKLAHDDACQGGCVDCATFGKFA